MEFINQILPVDILHALGWTVIHSLWQAFAVALLLAAYLLALQKTDAQKRYVAGNLALASILLLAVATFAFYLRKSAVSAMLAMEGLSENTGLGERQFLEEKSSYFTTYFSQHMPLIVTIWLIGLVFFLLKMLGGLLYIQRLKTRMVAELPSQWQGRLRQLSGELNIPRPVQLLESALARTPMVVGWLKPVVLLPLGAVNHLSAEQVEAILAHELAHIARHDYLLNLLQSFMEVLFYFNPAVWWVSSRVRAERENCCDDIAVRLCGNSLAYAKALVGLQELQASAPPLAMAFSRKRKHLLVRIQRILQPSQNKSNVMEKLSATLLLTVAVVLLSVQANTPLGNFITRVASKALPLDEIQVATAPDVYLASETDTIPDGVHNGLFHYNNEDESIEFEIENNKIISLKVDGNEIPEAEYGDYEDRIAEIMNNIPEPPEMPEPPDFPDFEEMPAPPAPPVMGDFGDFPMPAMAPMPPMPPTHTRKITTKKSGKGTTFIIENQDGSEPIEITVEDGKKGTIIVNGQEITGLKKGDKTVIMQDVPNFSWAGPQFEEFNADQMHFNLANPGFPAISPDAFTLAMPDYPQFDWNDEEMKAFQEKWHHEYRAKMEEFAKEFQFSDEWQAKYQEEIARLQEERARDSEERQQEIEKVQSEIEKTREKAMRDAQRSQELMRKKMEQERIELEKARQNRRRSGSM